MRGDELSHLQLDLKRFAKTLTSLVISVIVSVRIGLEEEVGESVNAGKCYQLGKLGEEETTVA